MTTFSPSRRRLERAEAYIERYAFPPSLMRKVAGEHPELRPDQLGRVAEGLREWLTCCLYRRGAQLGMPSRAVDWAWHQFILNTPAYHDFCRRVYGEYLHHVPESDMAVSMEWGLDDTVLAWDRSAAGRAGRDASLWELDEELELEQPIGVPPARRTSARSWGASRRHGRDDFHPGSIGFYAGGGDGGGAGGGCGGGGCGGGGG